MRYSRYAMWALVLVLLLAGTVLSCQKVTPTLTPAPTSTFTPTPIPTPTTAPTPTMPPALDEIRAMCLERSEDGLNWLNENPQYKDLMYVKNQAILTGQPRQIEQVAELVGLVKPQDSFDLDEQTAVYLYDLTESEKTVQQVTCEVNELEPFYGVWADPNYHWSPAQWIGGGSPWTQNGDWVGNPGGGQGSATEREFREQWAFGPDGMGLLDEQGVRYGDETGKGTRIVIFDTSPFTQTGRIDLFEGTKMDLTVWHQIDLIPAPDCPGGKREAQDISNHGLFVAGLAHAVAPASDIHLVRVLENDGCGTLYQIAKGIKTFIDEIAEPTRALPNTIINLSLGVHSTGQDDRAGLSNKIQLLEDVLADASHRGAIIVAAAGNDSYDASADRPRAMELPAGYDFCIGVVASNRDRMRGCFSNAGTPPELLDPEPANPELVDVAAPGGDGETREKMKCGIPTCSATHPDPCLISLVYKPQPGYAYWVGTSFAAPLYSGLRALLDEKQAAFIGPAITQYTCPSSDQTLPNGIINWAQVSGTTCP